jgi:short-subunit dehydrogenase
MKDYAGKTVWIIGASSGIGYALAVELSKRGASLILSARNADALRVLNILLGNHHKVVPFDISDTGNFAAVFSDLKSFDIDSTVYLAAAYEQGDIADITQENAHATISINLEGAFTLLREIVPYYRQRGKGQIALCGSVAGYRGLPGGQPYSATKAAIINLTESLRGEVAGKNIDVKLISPGFVRTPLTDKNDFSMPMMIEPEEAAREIADGLLTKRFEIRFPCSFTSIMKIMQILPYKLYFALSRKIHRK